MNIIIIGCGKVGLTLAQQLQQENHAITIVDVSKDRLEEAVGAMDIQAVLGNGTTYSTLKEAGLETADLLIAVTDHDEINMLSCLIARKAARCQAIARVRDPDYYEDIDFLKGKLGLSMVINPEWAAAQDIMRLLQIPSALDVDIFENSRVNMLRFPILPGSPLTGKNMIEISTMLGGRMLVCIREREGQIVIPKGDTDLQVGDTVSVVMPSGQIVSVLQRLNLQKKPIRAVTIAGGGSTSEYLAVLLLRAGMQVKIIESDRSRCELLAERLPKAQIICGDCSDKALLREEGLPTAEAFICLTGMDEENIMLALYAGKVSQAKVVTKISRIDFEEVVEDLHLGSVVDPKNITAESIVRYVRAWGNASKNNVETLYRLLDGRVEAMEFIVHPGSDITGIQIQKLKLKKDLLICSINRKGRIITPTGQDTIEEGDVVVIVTTGKGIRDLRDIVRS